MICNKLQLCVNSQLFVKTPPECTNHNKSFCIESSDKRPSVKCVEKKKKYILENTMKNHIISYKMDGGIIAVDKYVPEGTNKCDYLYVINNSESIAILTELKGVNVSKALKQISDTLFLFKDFFKKFSHVYGRAIVTSSTPDLKASPEYVNLVKLIRNTYHGNVKISKQQFSEKDIELSKD
ncbi:MULTISPECIES: hypothetical protein [Eisenbergiella]|uniref:Uncharacterized protein n=1 Tax=Eisenbergiella porci TaxID=2652274 RepID=A0A6N7WBA8_9FIRM|nr:MULTISPECIES: hypothetical protein [Eisenbergiella]MDY2651928.1 hypothetical protein [Eisenbergiella porci]MSS87025.1 hypothetical protein [Eisenbergiella porci]